MMLGYFLRKCGRSVILFLLDVGFIYRKKNNQPCKHTSRIAWRHSMPWLLRRFPVTLQGDSTQGMGQGPWGPVKHSLPFQNNIPIGNNLAFPANHELAWQSDQLVTPVHVIPHAWLITIASPRTQWIQPQSERGTNNILPKQTCTPTPHTPHAPNI